MGFIRRLRTAIELVLNWDEDLVLIDRETLEFYEAEEEWDNMWRAFEMPLETSSGVFPGLSEYITGGSA